MNAYEPTTRPVVPPPGDWRFPHAEESAGPGGMRLVTVQMPGQYLAAGRLVVGTPLEAEAPGQDGVATLVARTLDEGTARRSAEEFQQAIEALGAQYGAWSQEACTLVSVEAPAGTFGEALGLLGEAVTSPAFAPEEVDRHVRLRLSDIAAEAADPGTIAAEVARRRVFTAESRLSRPVGGSTGTIEPLTADEVRAHYRRAFDARRCTLVLVGDLPVQELRDAAAAAFAGWEASANAPTVAIRPRPAATPGPVVVDRPGAVQTEIVIAAPGPDRRAPDWAAHVVAARIMGGTVTSRLDAQLRERRGYTYGVRAAFTPFSRGGLFSITAAVRTEVSAAALTEALELVDVSSRPFTDEEVRDAVAFLVAAAPMRYETASDVASQLATAVACGMGPDYVDRHHRAMLAVTGEAATDSWRRTLPAAEGFVAVLAGDAEALIPALSSGAAGVRSWPEPHLWEG